MNKGKLNMTSSRPMGKPIFSKSVMDNQRNDEPFKKKYEQQRAKAEREAEIKEQEADEAQVEELRSNLRNFRVAAQEDDEVPARPRANGRSKPKPKVEYEEEEPEGEEEESFAKKKPRKESLWMMFQKEMRQTPEVQALPGKDRLAYITLKWKEYKESTPKGDQEDHMIKFRAKQMVQDKMRKKKEEAEMHRYQEYLESVAAQMEEDGEEQYNNIFKVSKKKA